MPVRGQRGGAEGKALSAEARAPFCPFALAVAVLAACGAPKGPPHRLEGSLSVLMDLRYDLAQIDLSNQDVAVRFVRKRSEGEDVVLKVTASLLGTAVDANEPIDLAEQTPAGAQRGTLSRNVFDDPRRELPALERGRLLFKSSVVPGANVAGEVSATFENGTHFASGRTVFGSFTAEVP